MPPSRALRSTFADTLVAAYLLRVHHSDRWVHWIARAKLAALTMVGLWLMGVSPDRALIAGLGVALLAAAGFAWQVISGAAVGVAVAGLFLWSLGIDATALVPPG